MTARISRRHFFVTAGSAWAAPWLLPDTVCAGPLGPVMESRMRALKSAIRAFEKTTRIYQPESWAYYMAKRRAQAAAERAFMTQPACEVEDDAIMQAFELYARIAPSAFAVQTARDLFTPRRYQNCEPESFDNIREGLLTDPDEMFAKSPVPEFLWEMRRAYRLHMA